MIINVICSRTIQDKPSLGPVSTNVKCKSLFYKTRKSKSKINVYEKIVPSRTMSDEVIPMPQMIKIY